MYLHPLNYCNTASKTCIAYDTHLTQRARIKEVPLLGLQRQVAVLRYKSPRANLWKRMLNTKNEWMKCRLLRLCRTTGIRIGSAWTRACEERTRTAAEGCCWGWDTGEKLAKWMLWARHTRYRVRVSLLVVLSTLNGRLLTLVYLWFFFRIDIAPPHRILVRKLYSLLLCKWIQFWPFNVASFHVVTQCIIFYLFTLKGTWLCLLANWVLLITIIFTPGQEAYTHTTNTSSDMLWASLYVILGVCDAVSSAVA